MERKSPTPKAGQTSRDDRLKAALKANLARRKAQARARHAGGEAAAGDTGQQGRQEQKD
ncbi:hypothetical protein [Thalassococcus lentus]|uniref:DUF4169 domain-containing protein n=1 Tax=Thalassococcus lentus TaxID=1210524 RepID=A0ABT4XU20_9RHOB|nr:hypothetical protein [Thalassococcus lentus]MDA7425456.1 hypothetical protein [Thalassococcus lentus]